MSVSPLGTEPPVLEDIVEPAPIPLLRERIVAPEPSAPPELEVPTLCEVLDTPPPVTAARLTPHPAPLIAPEAEAEAEAEISVAPVAEPLARIERELQAAAQQIVREVVADYLPQIERELHRRLEEQLGRLLRAGRR